MQSRDAYCGMPDAVTAAGARAPCECWPVLLVIGAVWVFDALRRAAASRVP